MEKGQTAEPGASAAESRGVEGMLLVDKPAGITSHDVVLIARRAYGERSIGHLGTLDPFATGLLILLLGKATRLANHMDVEPKVYDATIHFGAETDTDDSTGSVTREADVPVADAVSAAVGKLTGTFAQIPPDYSAKSVDGTRAYKTARKGAPVELRPARVTVHSWEIRERTNDSLRAKITCSGGTYIRALARDLGRATNSAAHLSALRRLSIGEFDVRDAMSLDQVKAAQSPPRKLRIVVADD